MNSQNPHPDHNTNSSGHHPNSNSQVPIVDPNTIAKFHNPHNSQSSKTNQDQPVSHAPNVHSGQPNSTQSGHLVAAKPTEIPRKPHHQSTTNHLHGHVNAPRVDNKKQDARIKLIKMRKQSHWHTIRFALISFVVFLIIFNFQFIYSQAQFLVNSRFNQKSSSTTPIKPVIPTNQAEVVEGPNVLIIPKLNVTAPIVFIDTTEEKSVLTALQDGVVHYAGTANPGENGNSVFFGHSSNDLWEKGNYKFIFALLEKLTVGDQYEIHYQNKKYIYTVEETKVVAPTDLSVLNQTTTPYSTLITCTPPGTSWKRFIVKAKQTSPIGATQVAINNNTLAKPAVLPSAPPSIVEQIQIAFGNLINMLMGRNSNSPSSADPSTQPSTHLPEVSKNSTMPTTF